MNITTTFSTLKLLFFSFSSFFTIERSIAFKTMDRQCESFSRIFSSATGLDKSFIFIRNTWISTSINEDSEIFKKISKFLKFQKIPKILKKFQIFKRFKKFSRISKFSKKFKKFQFSKNFVKFQIFKKFKILSKIKKIKKFKVQNFKIFIKLVVTMYIYVEVYFLKRIKLL